MYLLVWLYLLFHIFTGIGPLPLFSQEISPFASTAELPAAYQGRFRPVEVVSKSWLYQVYHKDSLKTDDLAPFNAENNSALDLLWRIHFLGHHPFDLAPLFWVHYAEIKSLLHLPAAQDRFSFSDLNKAIYESKETQVALLRKLLLFTFIQEYHAPSNRTSREKIELKNLIPGLILKLEKNALVIAETPKQMPWKFLLPGLVVDPDGRQSVISLQHPNKNLVDEIVRLLQEMRVYSSYGPSESSSEAADLPLLTQLRQSGTTLKMLPLKMVKGEWVSLHALKIMTPTENFTSFSDHAFENIRAAYLNLEHAVLHKPYEPASIEQMAKRFSEEFHEAYAELIGQPYQIAANKSLFYPGFTTLKLEQLYYTIPLIEIAIVLYLLALICEAWPKSSLLKKKHRLNNLSLSLLIAAFLVHSLVLAIRCYILHRPPVSNMFETMIYVPWAGMAIGFIFYFKSQMRFVLLMAAAGSVALLILLKLTAADAQLENVQAVLDSQYWLIVHVLMVVGSYGAFIVSGILGHLFLLSLFYYRQENGHTRQLARGILYTIYVGTGLLIPGTILGGIWAAESWGRFWDWDPKESWAFISSCVYLLIIHSYTFRYIRDFGLAVGAVAGLMTISFTWYGVNYVLGTGLHSYGFGKGGEWIYFGYLLLELIFICSAGLYRSWFKSLDFDKEAAQNFPSGTK